ncbi:MAG: HDOD domain-containing protein [Chthoniobacteraceae bacterium]
MSILKSFFTSSHGEHAAAVPPPAAPPAKADGPRLLVTGDGLDWLRTRTEIAGRTIVTARTAENAVALLAAEPFDGVMAGFRNVQASVSLLDSARASKPAIACSLCADTGELGQVKHAYPVVSRTEQVEVLDDRLRTMFAVSKLGSNPALSCVLGYIRKFPSLPSLYTQITAALQEEETPLRKIVTLIAREPAVSAKLLQMVNSAAFSRQHRVTSILEAAQVLGVGRLRSLVLATGLFGQFDGSKCASFSVAEFESHSGRIADWAAGIARSETFDKRHADMAFTAGLLHRFGVLLLAANLPEAYDQVLRIAKEQRVSIARVEHDTYGVTHAELAGYILATWGIPFPIVNAVGWYMRPSQSEDISFSALSAVHLAHSIDLFERTRAHDYDRAYVEKVTKISKIDGWHRTLMGDGWAG